MEKLHDDVMDWKQELALACPGNSRILPELPVLGRFEKANEDDMVIKIIGMGRQGSDTVRSMIPHNAPYDNATVELIVTDTDCSEIIRSCYLTTDHGVYTLPFNITQLPQIINKDRISNFLKNTDLLIVILYASEINNDLDLLSLLNESEGKNILTIIILAIPSAKHENDEKILYQNKIINQLEEYADTIIPLCCDKISDFYGCNSSCKIFTDKIIRIFTSSIVETQARTGHIGIDFSDIKYVLQKKSFAKASIATVYSKKNVQTVHINNIKETTFTIDLMERDKQFLLSHIIGLGNIAYMSASNFLQKKHPGNCDVVLSYFDEDKFKNNLQIVSILLNNKNE